MRPRNDPVESPRSRRMTIIITRIRKQKGVRRIPCHVVSNVCMKPCELDMSLFEIFSTPCYIMNVSWLSNSFFFSPAIKVRLEWILNCTCFLVCMYTLRRMWKCKEMLSLAIDIRMKDCAFSSFSSPFSFLLKKNDWTDCAHGD